ncbi:hypothetical protein [Falsiroseomonas sp. HW251]|uniref:hypothetical protein n=1 Tax=Falsiroseomonas sp. HW251 TaxID=3390998 RepID=UPI003D3116A5
MAALPGMTMEIGLGLGLEVASGADKALSLVSNIQGVLNFGQPFLDFLAQRAESRFDTSVQQYSAHILAELNDCVKMATALHDALLPDFVGAFIDADALGQSIGAVVGCGASARSAAGADTAAGALRP